MSELKTNKVSPATGTALAVGDSGDTITIPSGATLDISASTLTPPATMPASSGVNLTSLTAANLTGTLPAISGASLTSLNATNLGSGTVPTARLGSGTADATTFLRGDQSYVAVSGGLAQASQWRLTTDFTGGATPIASNLEEVDTGGYARIGSAMTESSGVFSFPVTGIWYIEFWTRFGYDGSSRFVVSYIYTTVDDGTWVQCTESGDNISTVSGARQAYTRSAFVFDVTNVSTHKCRFHVGMADASVSTTGNSTYTQTGMSFLKLGDT